MYLCTEQLEAQEHKEAIALTSQQFPGDISRCDSIVGIY